MNRVVHVLHQGLPLCRFTTELPCNWPVGHVWTRAAEASAMRASCVRCLAGMQQAFPPQPPDSEPDVLPPDDDDWWMDGF